MDEKTARKMYKDLAREHGLLEKGWKVMFNDRISSAGLCSDRKKVLYLSRKFLKDATNEQIRNTMLHEIAHALEFDKWGESSHNWRFRNLCVEIGCDPDSNLNRETLYGNKYDKWTYTCKGCGAVVGTAKRLKNIDKRTCVTCRSHFTEKKNF